MKSGTVSRRLFTRLNEEDRFKCCEVVAHSSLDAIFMCSLNTLQFVEVNDAAASRSGYTHDELLHFRFHEIFPNIGVDRLNEIIQNLQTKELSKVALETLSLRKDGSYYPVTIVLSMVVSQAPVLVVVSRDDSEKKRSEERYRKQEQLLSQQAKLASLGEMIGAIAHQWRQPLNAIGIMIQNLEFEYDAGALDAERINEFIDKSMEKIEYMSQTINDFRSFFLPTGVEIFDLEQCVRDAVSIVSVQLQTHAVTLDVSVQSEKTEPFFVEGNMSEFKQSLINMLNNAVQSIDERRVASGDADLQGRITIDLYDRVGSYLLSLEDNGTGIRPEIMSRLFEPYFTTKPGSIGTGIGLYMVKMIVDKMNGLITVMNTGDGAKFVITIPKRNEKLQA